MTLNNWVAMTNRKYFISSKCLIYTYIYIKTRQWAGSWSHRETFSSEKFHPINSSTSVIKYPNPFGYFTLFMLFEERLFHAVYNFVFLLNKLKNNVANIAYLKKSFLQEN